MPQEPKNQDDVAKLATSNATPASKAEALIEAPLIDLLNADGILHAIGASNYRKPLQADGLRNHLVGLGKVTEPNATKFLTYVARDGEAAVIKAFCKVAGIPYHSEMLLISGTDYRQRLRLPGNRSIDLIVIEKTLVDGMEGCRALIAVEAKFDADVNGEFNYCAAHDESMVGKYAAQSTCYIAGHLGGALHPDSVPFIWMDLVPDSSLAMFNRKGITERHSAHLDEAWASQQEAEAIWLHMSWGALWDALEDATRDHPHAAGIMHAAGCTPERRRRVTISS